MELFFGLIGANLPQGFLGLLAIIAGLIVIALAFVFVVDLLLSIIAPNTRGIFFRRNVKDDKRNQTIAVSDTTTSAPATPTITAYEDDDEFTDTATKTTTTTTAWDDELVEREQEDLLAGGKGMDDEFEDFEQKDFTSDREEAINRRRQEFEDFDNLYNIDENNDAEDINKLIDEVNEYAIAQYYNAGDDTGALEVEADEQPEETLVDETPVEEADAIVEETEVVVEELELPVEEETETETVETAEVVEPIAEDETISATSTTEDTIVEAVETQEQPEETTPAVETETPAVEAEPVVAPAETVVVTKTIISDVTLEQLENRLAVLQERLKANEKDLKANRKEYLPLARVQKTLEKDQEKLRRREAVVARKKVILYGVNNYVDIDEEKAKKLSEDLDLLDGLRLSVQHCEDVMNANKDRFPILEKTNTILVGLNRDLKSDIADIQKAIEQYKANQGM